MLMPRAAADKKKALVKLYADNHAMCKLTEDVIFTCPYVDKPSFANRWSAPLEPAAKAGMHAHRILLFVLELSSAVLC